MAWKHKTLFYDRVVRLNLHGLHFQHISLCERRAWMYLHGINFAAWYEKVQNGAALHQISYRRDRSVNGLFGLAPDRIDWEKRIVYENKGTKGAKEASDNQTAFYAVMLTLATQKKWRAMTYVLSTRRYREVLIDAFRLNRLFSASERLEILSQEIRASEKKFYPKLKL